MKKFKIFLSLILALTITLKISTVVNADDTQTIESFEELKEIINKNLNINNNHYVYSQEQKENIKNAVYSFDINSYQNLIGKNITHEELLKQIMNDIDNADLNIHVSSQNQACQVDFSMNTLYATQSKYCNRNYSYETWSETIIWIDSGKTIAWSNELSDRASATTVVGAGTTFLGPAGMPIGIVCALSAFYYGSLAQALAVNDTGCGVKASLQKYLPLFDVKNQRNL